MSTKKNHEVYLDYPNNGVVRPYIEKHEDKMEIHDYGSEMKGKYLVNVYNKNGTHFSRTRYPDRESAIREKQRIEEGE